MRRALGEPACCRRCHGGGQSRFVERLDHVVDRTLLERLHRVLLERRDEHDLRRRTDRSAPRRCRSARHVHVEKHHVGPRAVRTARPPRVRCAPAATHLRARATAAPGAWPGARAAAARRRRSARWWPSCGTGPWPASTKLSSRARHAARGLSSSSLASAPKKAAQTLAQRCPARCRRRSAAQADPGVAHPQLRRAASRRRRSAPTSMRPPCSLGSMPWRTAFSTSVSSAIGGKRRPSSAGSTSICTSGGRACACASARGRRAPGRLVAHERQARPPAAAASRRAGRRSGCPAPARRAANRSRPAPARWPAC